MTLRNTNICLFIFVLFCLGCIYSCKDKEILDVDRDPNKPTVFTDFSPKTGAVRTRLHIYGSNFGTDISKIHVYIGEREMTVIGSTGNHIYAMVPRQSGSGSVKVVIDGAPQVEYVFSESFEYVTTSTVGTLVGKVDELGNSSIVDGTFEEAGFNYPSWALYEPVSNVLFVVEADRSVRKVDIGARTVSTLITNGQAAFHAIQTASLSFDNDTLFIVDDNGQNNKNQVAIAYTLRSENFRRVHPYIYDRTSYSCAYHPVDKDMYFNTWWGGAIMKVLHDPVTGELTSKELFKVGGNTNMKPNLFFHPTGNFAYILVNGCVWKSTYNWQTKELGSPIVFAGSSTSTGDVDAIGTSARFQFLYQGVFVKNPDYVGQPDEYDFYLCDINNHSVRKVTPTGEVSTFAGKGSPSSDGSKAGYIDGDLRKEARFNNPSGIAYDETRKIFYITERTNRRIRTITTD